MLNVLVENFFSAMTIIPGDYNMTLITYWWPVTDEEWEQQSNPDQHKNK